MKPSFSSDTYSPDQLLYNTDGLRTGDGTVLTGQTLTRGAVVALDSANGNKLVAVDSASGTASIQSPYAILAEDVDASAADVGAALYLAGEFNERSLTFGGTDTVDDHRVAMRPLGLFVRQSVSA